MLAPANRVDDPPEQRDGQYCLLGGARTTSPYWCSYEEFEAEESITIAAANGGAVVVEVNGEELAPLGRSGEGVTRTFTTEFEG